MPKTASSSKMPKEHGAGKKMKRSESMPSSIDRPSTTLQDRASRNAAAKALERKLLDAIRESYPGATVSFGSISYEGPNTVNCSGFTLSLPNTAADDDLFHGKRVVVADGVEVIRGRYHSGPEPTQEELDLAASKKAAKDRLNEQWDEQRRGRKTDVDNQRQKMEKELEAKQKILSGLQEIQVANNQQRVKQFQKKKMEGDSPRQGSEKGNFGGKRR